VDAVGLEEFGLVAEPFQEKGDQRHPLGLGDPREHRGELLAVGAAVVGGHLHAQQQRARAGLLGGAHHLAQVRLGAAHRQAAQRIVAAELDQHVGRAMSGEQIGQARASARARLAADAGVDHLDPELALIDPARQQRDPAAASRQAVFGRQAVADHEQPARGLGRARPSTRQRRDQGARASQRRQAQRRAPRRAARSCRPGASGSRTGAGRVGGATACGSAPGCKAAGGGHDGGGGYT
jgi:hypothetical protein